MALRLAICSTETRDVYSVRDPAVDVARSNLDAYRQDLDARHLVFRPGDRTTFRVRALSEYERAHVQASSHDASLGQSAAWVYAALRLGLASVTGLDGWDGRRQTSGGIEQWTAESFRDWPYLLALEIASYIETLSRPPAPFSTPSSPSSTSPEKTAGASATTAPLAATATGATAPSSTSPSSAAPTPSDGARGG